MLIISVSVVYVSKHYQFEDNLTCTGSIRLDDDKKIAVRIVPESCCFVGCF
jgi:hypothetical protein